MSKLFSSCFGLRRSEDDREPLLPQYNDDTNLQAALHEKLHSYQMLQAIRRGYMPSTEQLIANLRSFLSADILNPDDPSLSASGRRLTKLLKQWLKDFITLLSHKNSEDEVQDLIWDILHARVSVDVDDIATTASKARAKADAAAVYSSLQTVGSLLLGNAEFRLFLSDLSTVARQVFQDTAEAVSGVAEDAGKQLAPSDEAVRSLEHKDVKDVDVSKTNGVDKSAETLAPAPEDLGNQVTEASKVVASGVGQVADEARLSLKDKLSGQERETLLFRLKRAVLQLRKRPDYDQSVSTLSTLLRRYALVYSRAIQESTATLQDDVHENEEADKAVRNAWSLVSSFGNKNDWEELEARFKQVMSHKEKDPEFEDLTADLSASLEKLLTDPDFLDSAEEKFEELRRKTKKVGTESDLRDDIDAFLVQGQKTGRSVINDQDVSNLIRTTTEIFDVFSPAGDYVNANLLHDVVNVFGPHVISAIQSIPIPRLEVSTPEIDILLENLIITPGHTINKSSFLPYLFGLTTQNDIIVRKAHTSRITSSLSTHVTFKLDGLSARADNVGFWLKTHAGLLRFTDSGLASFALDERGMDVHVDVAIAQNSLDQILSLKAVRVHIHKLDFKLKSSSFSILAWVFRPLLRPLLRKVLERQIALAVADMFRSANREVVFARERLRATRIADPKDIVTFVKAVAARLTPEDDPDVYSRVGIDEPGKGVFKGKYAPGSLVKLWAEEGRNANERVRDGAEVIGRGQTGWRNEVFDIHTRLMT